MSFEKLTKYASYLDQGSSTMAANAIDMACKEGAGDYNHTLFNVAKFATMLESDALYKASDYLKLYLKVSESMDKVANLPGVDEKYDYKQHREDVFFNALVDEAQKEPSPTQETFEGGAHPLLTRYSPDYPGVMMLRISDGVYQDLLSKKVYDFSSGFISDTGIRYYGGSVANQTPKGQNYLNSPQISDSQHLKIRPRR